MTARNAATHVIHDSKNHRLECTHCGASEPDKLPMLADLYAAMAKAFIALHRDCKDGDQEARL